MAKLYNLARMNTATAGTGTMSLGSAVSGFLTFAQAGIADGDVISYAIRDGSNSEIGTGTYTASGTTLTRTVTQSTNSNGLISLSGSAQVFITPNASNFRLDQLSDVNITEGSSIHGKSLYWDNTSSKWVTALPVPSVTSWRVRNIAAGDGGEWTRTAEMQFRLTAGTPETPSGGTVLAGSPGYAGAGGQTAANAFDGNAATDARHDNFGGLQSTDWMGYQFATARQVAEVSITSTSGSFPAETPSNFVIEYLDPVSSNWVALNYYTSTSWTASTTRTFAVSGAAALQIANLADFTGSPSDLQVLQWSVTTHKWTPVTLSTIPTASSATPLMDGTATVGTTGIYAREGHIHPTDTSRAAVASPTLTGKAIINAPNAQGALTVTPVVQLGTDARYRKLITLSPTTGRFRMVDPGNPPAAVFDGDVVYMRGNIVFATTGSLLVDSTSIASFTTAGVALLGVPTAPTAAANTNTTQIATTAYVIGQGYAKLAGATFTGAVVLPAGTTGLAPLTFTSGTNLTTAAAGALEYDGTCFYSSMAASTRGVLPSMQTLVQNGTKTLTSQTAAQPLFNASAGGAVTLPVGTYEFECCFSLISMSSTSGSFGFAFTGGATRTEAWWAYAVKPATSNLTATSPQASFNVTANTTIATATTATTAHAFIKGIVRITVTGTLIPNVSLGIAAAAVVGINSYFKIWPIGSATVTTVGNWS